MDATAARKKTIHLLAVLAAVSIALLLTGCRAHTPAGGKPSAPSRTSKPVPNAREPKATSMQARSSVQKPPVTGVVNPPVTGLLGDKLTQQQATSAANRILLPGHPRSIESGVLSPNRKTIAIYDGTGVFLTDGAGKHVRRARIPLFENLANEHVSVAFAFRPDSRRIAVLTTLVYGEPMGAFIERLWTVDVATGRYRRLSEWADRVQGSAPVTAEREIEGWTRDGRAVIVTGTVFAGAEMPVDAHKVGTQRVIVRDLPCSRQRRKI